MQKAVIYYYDTFTNCLLQSREDIWCSNEHATFLCDSNIKGNLQFAKSRCKFAKVSTCLRSKHL